MKDSDDKDKLLNDVNDKIEDLIENDFNDNRISAINESARASTINPLGRHSEAKDFKPQEEIKKSEEKVEFSKYGIIIVLIFFLLNFINGMHWITFAACAAKFGKFYHLSNIGVDMLSLIFMIVYIFSSYPCSWFIDKKSMRWGLSFAAISLIIGSILKIFINVHISFAYIGQIFTSLLQPAILNSPAKIAATWFSEKWRVLVTSICCISNTIGVMFGYIVHTFIMEENIVNPKIFKDGFRMYLIVEAIITIVSGLVFIILMREKPKIPPSKSQLIEIKTSPLEEIKELFHNNKNFLFLCASLSCVVGYVNIFATIFNSYMALYKISDTHASYISAIANFFGIFTAIGIGAIIDKIKNYKIVLIICNSLAIIFYIITAFVLELVKSKNLYIIVGVLFTLVIGSAIPIYTSGMDLVCEITFGVGESTSDGVIMLGNQAIGIIGIFISALLRTNLKHIKYLTNIFCIFLLGISLICLFFVKQELKRTEKDDEKYKTPLRDPNNSGIDEEIFKEKK